MEHLNRLLKNGISALSSNTTEKSITQLSKASEPILANLDDIVTQDTMQRTCLRKSIK